MGREWSRIPKWETSCSNVRSDSPWVVDRESYGMPNGRPCVLIDVRTPRRWWLEGAVEFLFESLGFFEICCSYFDIFPFFSFKIENAET